MKRLLMTAAAIMALSGNVLAEDAVKSSMVLGIQGDYLYSFATSASQKNGVVGGGLENITDQELSIMRAESDVAERVELHTHEMDGDVMKMREVESYTVEPYDEFELGPKAEHIMLIGLKTPLKQGDVFSVRLFDEAGANIEVPVLVRAPGDIPESDDDKAAHHDHDDHEHGHDHHEH